MSAKVTSLSREGAGTFPGGCMHAAGAFPNTSAPDEMERAEAAAKELARARAVLAFVVDHSDAEIAAACCVLRDSPESDERDKADAESLLRHLTGVEAANA